MSCKMLCVPFVFLIGIVVYAQSAVPPAQSLSAQELAAAIEETLAERGNMGVGNVSNGSDYRINLIHRTSPAGAIVHAVGTELHYITAGSGILVTGGTLVRPANGAGAVIEGGFAQEVNSGDAILIPQGTPHWYSAIEDSVSYLEVRFQTADFD